MTVWRTKGYHPPSWIIPPLSAGRNQPLGIVLYLLLRYFVPPYCTVPIRHAIDLGVSKPPIHNVRWSCTTVVLSSTMPATARSVTSFICYMTCLEARFYDYLAPSEIRNEYFSQIITVTTASFFKSFALTWLSQTRSWEIRRFNRILSHDVTIRYYPPGFNPTWFTYGKREDYLGGEW
jgi:hypothetical protein